MEEKWCLLTSYRKPSKLTHLTINGLAPSSVCQEMHDFAREIVDGITCSESNVCIIALGKEVCDSLEAAKRDSDLKTR